MVLEPLLLSVFFDKAIDLEEYLNLQDYDIIECLKSSNCTTKTMQVVFIGLLLFKAIKIMQKSDLSFIFFGCMCSTLQIYVSGMLFLHMHKRLIGHAVYTAVFFNTLIIW